MLRSPLQGLKNKHVECSLQQLNPVFILVFLVHRCRHSTRSGSRLSTPVSWRRLNYEKSIASFLPSETDRVARRSVARLAKRQGDFDVACELWKGALGNSRHG